MHEQKAFTKTEYMGKLEAAFFRRLPDSLKPRYLKITRLASREFIVGTAALAVGLVSLKEFPWVNRPLAAVAAIGGALALTRSWHLAKRGIDILANPDRFVPNNPTSGV